MDNIQALTALLLKHAQEAQDLANEAERKGKMPYRIAKEIRRNAGDCGKVGKELRLVTQAYFKAQKEVQTEV